MSNRADDEEEAVSDPTGFSPTSLLIVANNIMRKSDENMVQ